MPGYDIETAILKRRYDVASGEDVWIYIWAPSKGSGDDYYVRCNYKIVGLEDEPIQRYMLGIDDIEALCFTLGTIQSYLENSDLAKSGRLSWCKSTTNFGLLPLPDAPQETAHDL